MRKYFIQLRNSLLTLAVFGALAVGGLQSFASSSDIEQAAGTCNAWACRSECGVLGGVLVPGGPGQPLKCACCG